MITRVRHRETGAKGYYRQFHGRHESAGRAWESNAIVIDDWLRPYGHIVWPGVDYPRSLEINWELTVLTDQIIVRHDDNSLHVLDNVPFRQQYEFIAPEVP